MRSPETFFVEAMFRPPLLPRILIMPRTVWACQPVAAMMSASVTPLARFIIAITAAFFAPRQAREKWGKMLPYDGDLLAWCLKQKQVVLLDLLAFCVAATVNAVRLKSNGPGNERLQHTDSLAAVLKLDMKAWFTPDAANYFSRVR